MQKKKLVVIAITFIVFLSLVQLTDLVISDSQGMSAASYVRLKYLIVAYGMVLIMLAALFFVDGFQMTMLILFLFCANVTVAFTLCEIVVSNMPVHSGQDLLVLHKSTSYQKSVQKSYLSLFYLMYMYSIIGGVILGIFLLVRCLLIKHYQRQLMKQLKKMIIPIAYSSQLKGVDCTICLNQFQERDQNLYELKNCHHIFHARCIQEWINYSKTCPICRNSIINFRRSRESL